MPRHSFRWFFVLLLAAIAGFFIWYKTRPQALEVAVEQVSRGTVEKIVANTRVGTLEACRTANLSPSIGGQISVLKVEEGDRVKKGQLLVELWNNDLRSERVLAEKEVEAAEAHAAAALLQSQIAGREADRMRKLIADSAISEQDADAALTEAKVRQAAYDAAITEVAARRARLGVIEANLERTMLFAPFDGIIAKINGELNEYVTPSPQGIPTPPTIELLDTSCFYVTAPIDEVDAPLVRVGMETRVIMDAFREQHFPGRVRRIDPYVLDLEKQARTVDVEVEFSSSNDRLQFLAGYSADVEIIVAAEDEVLRIPTQAILDGNRVFVFNPDQKRLQERTVTIGLSNWDNSEVVEGLQENEYVVVSTDRQGLEDGAPARISPEE